jgi:hypothetical protein
MTSPPGLRAIVTGVQSIAEMSRDEIMLFLRLYNYRELESDRTYYCLTK